MNKQQFDFTASVVWAVLEPFLKLHFGERCDEFEFGCECCERWRLADKLLAFDSPRSPQTLTQEIETLKTSLQWREELLSKMEK